MGEFKLSSVGASSIAFHRFNPVLGFFHHTNVNYIHPVLMVWHYTIKTPKTEVAVFSLLVTIFGFWPTVPGNAVC